jgi:HEPN domain-containing protein
MTDPAPPDKIVRAEFARDIDYSSNAHSWAHWAQRTYTASQALFAHDNPDMWFGAAVLAHQSVEMCLKAILVAKGRRVVKDDVWGHDLVQLLKQVQLCGINLPPEFEDDFRVFNGFFNELRYPSALRQVSEFGKEDSWRLSRIIKVLAPLADAAGAAD